MNKKTNRKDDHLALAQAFHKENSNDFDGVHFVHQSFSEMAMSQVNLSTSFLGFSFSSPFFINAITGGSKKSKLINQQIGIIAKETGIMVATGSVNAALKDPKLIDTYQIIRKENPKGIIFTNLGAGCSLEQAKRAIDLIQADGLQIHVNLAQELVMPEGDRDFRNWLNSIQLLTEQLAIPLIVKEVGFGMSQETLKKLQKIGVKAVDISGQGGTNFIQIENARREKKELAFLNDWGQSTIISLLESTNLHDEMTVLASGGIRHSLDIVKALSLGASSVGIAGTILDSLINDGLDLTIQLVQKWQEELKILYTLLGKKRTADLNTTDIVFDPFIISWCKSRGIDYRAFAFRDNFNQ